MFYQKFQIQLLKAMDTNQGTLIELINHLNTTIKIHHNISLNEYYFVRFANVNEDYHIMSKTTMGTKLPRKLEEKMKVVGEQIRLARLRRDLSIAQVAERATCSPVTISRVEKGAPTVAIGIYLRVLYALQLDDDILLLAQKDEIGRGLQDLRLKQRERASKKM